MKSALFMIEQLIVVLIFAVCAAVCVKILTASYIISEDSRDMSNALIISECGAESFKAAAGDAEMTALILGGHIGGDGTVSVYYDENRQVCNYNQAVYIMNIVHKSPPDAPDTLNFSDITVTKAGNSQIITYTAAARRGG